MSFIYTGGAGQSPEAETAEAVVGGRSGRDREQAWNLDALGRVVAVVQRRDARVADLPHLDLRHLVGDRRLEAPRVAQLAALGVVRVRSCWHQPGQSAPPAAVAPETTVAPPAAASAPAAAPPASAAAPPAAAPKKRPLEDGEKKKEKKKKKKTGDPLADAFAR